MSLAYNSEERSEFRRIRGSLQASPTVQMFSGAERGSDSQTLAWGKCYGDIDESAEMVLAWLWDMCSYQRMDAHRKHNGDLVRRTDASESNRSQTVASENKVSPGLAYRRSETKYSWSKLELGENENKLTLTGYVIAFEPVLFGKAGHRQPNEELKCSENDFSEKSVVATTFGLFLLEKIAPRITKMTMVQRVDLGGDIPYWVMNLGAAHVLSLVNNVQETFRRVDRVVDKVRWTPFFLNVPFCRFVVEAHKESTIVVFCFDHRKCATP